MAASNKQPTGSRPGPAAPHTHAPNQSGKPSAGFRLQPNGGHSGVTGSKAPHGTPKPIGEHGGATYRKPSRKGA